MPRIVHVDFIFEESPQKNNKSGLRGGQGISPFLEISLAGNICLTLAIESFDV